MTTRNVHHATTDYHYRGKTYSWQSPDVSRFAHRTFNGYHRSDGRVGTANYWLFIPMVFCENRNLDVIKEALQNELGYGTPSYRHLPLVLDEHGEKLSKQTLASSINTEDKKSALAELRKAAEHLGLHGLPDGDITIAEWLLSATHAWKNTVL